MKVSRHTLRGWRLAILLTGFASLLLGALPAQAGLGHLLDNLLDPVQETAVIGIAPIAGDVVGPLIDDTVEPVVSDPVDPIVDDDIRTTVATVVTPVVDDAVTPVLDIVDAPATETIPTVAVTTTTTLRVLPSDEEETAWDPAGLSPSSSGYRNGALFADSLGSSGDEVGAVQSTLLRSLEAALALQTTLVDSTRTAPTDGDKPAPGNRVEGNWLNGLTDWLRSSADGFLDILAMPIRLLELVARALLTAGSGLIAPLSMLVAFTALLIKDRHWGRAMPRDSDFRAGRTDHRRAGPATISPWLTERRGPTGQWR